jgi:Whi5 like
LKLASYKVRTNQIDIPLDRLEIKTLSSTSPELPRLPGAANTSQHHVQISSTSTALPAMQLQIPCAEQRRVEQVRITSSPPPYLEITNHSPVKESASTREGEYGGCTTPILPRQRQGILQPPQLGSPIWNEVTSSVVKSRAANGLLELMREQN